MTMTHGPVVIRRRLGFVLKQLRGQRGLLLDSVARQLEISPSKLSRLETGQVEPKIRDVRDLLDIYDAGAEVREQIMDWATDAKQPGWWQPFSIEIPADLDMYISLEAEAHSLQIYSIPISGLLQTEEYARAIIRGVVPHTTKDDLDTLVNVRLGRQRVIDPDRDDAPPLQLHAILDESALHRFPEDDDGGVAADQLQTLLERSERPHVTLQVLPFSAGYTSGSSSTFAIFEPRQTTDWTVVNVESTGADAYYDTPNEISRYRAIWKDVLAKALDPDRSRDLIRDLIAQRRTSS
ncbi:helix-turn-helix protein [Pseudonocardia sediminis]|uniref:Helix-turn-helix protein n=1 Tax=Pseudonocardia sediminis TaxID=1397368 RepID=A0A4Q7US07_PSEST|nr:helix-turn-helix transcriptional regulator [Pseudonocardia sediminis]RZT83501.1 helix-turn-helix protein [Pseudonocardia sediminis]